MDSDVVDGYPDALKTNLTSLVSSIIARDLFYFDMYSTEVYKQLLNILHAEQSDVIIECLLVWRIYKIYVRFIFRLFASSVVVTWLLD